jgi:hypothetical protein
VAPKKTTAAHKRKPKVAAHEKSSQTRAKGDTLHRAINLRDAKRVLRKYSRKKS